MKKLKGRQVAAAGICLALAVVAAGTVFFNKKSSRARVEAAQLAQQWERAASTPTEAYPETVTYTLSKMTSADNSKMPEGDTYEDNAYTRYLKEKLNVQNEDVMEVEQDDHYDLMLRRMVIEGTVPDVMLIDDYEYLKKLVENDMVEDLTAAYEECTSATIKEIYGSYGSSVLDAARFDGKLMALPSTQIYPGCSLLWLRDDWRLALGLEEPKTITDVEDILLAFRESYGKSADSIGLACSVGLVGMENSNYSLDPLFASFGAYPQVWLQGEDGHLTYGSLTGNTKQALAYLHSWYEEGILDENYMMRTPTEIGNLIQNGQCGAFFGWWWAPNNPLMDAKQNNPDALWRPYLITDEQGVVNSYIPYQSARYVAVRKGYEHPELVMKIMTALFDDARFQEKIPEIEEYYAAGVDITARPLVINCDYSRAAFYATDHIVHALEGVKSYEALSSMEKTYYDQCQKYLGGAAKDAKAWAAYSSPVEAVGLIVDGDVRYVNEHYVWSMEEVKSEELYELEILAFMKIITGEEPISYFDQFVEEWMQQGSEELLLAGHP